MSRNERRPSPALPRTPLPQAGEGLGERARRTSGETRIL